MEHREIHPNGIYTSKETEQLLKISGSTVKRLLKKGLIKANKVGRQYRILGKEILRLISPDVEKRAVESYLKLKAKAVNKLNKW
jgi:excisionase family DNA binding protein